MSEELRKHEDTPDLTTALQRAAQVWRIGSQRLLAPRRR
jgi:hypothetical protein